VNAPGVGARAGGAAAAPEDPARRIAAADALRGLALLGILQVNIQSFTWGTGDVLGYLRQPPGGAESLLYFLQAAFIEGKFYPLFAFLFGFGLAVQLRRLRREGLAAPARRRLFLRRQGFLLALGVLHALLLYYGDVLAPYAACALILVAVVGLDPRPRRLLRFAQGALLASVLAVLLFLLVYGLPEAAPGPQASGTIDAATIRAHELYTRGGFADALRQRAHDAAWQQIASSISFWPQVLALMAAGALAGRLGWLHHPGRHARGWRRVRHLGLWIGLPVALAGAALQLQAARQLPGGYDPWADALCTAGSLLAAAYAAAAVVLLSQYRCARIRGWLACTGRASLSNYLAQSLAMNLLLCGWGLGWGAAASRAELALLGLAIYAAQVVASRWWLTRHRQGPVESLWRRWTYG
jgi:uncharacterized protein